MGFLADILADALRHPVPGSTPDAGDGAPWEDDGAASPEWGGARAPRSADHAWEARTDSGDGAAPLEKVASVVPRGQGGTLAGGARVPAQSLPDPAHVLSRGAGASQASSRMPSSGPLPYRSVPEDGSTGAADRVPAPPLASVALLRRHAQGPATPPVFEPSGTRPEEARQGTASEATATRAPATLEPSGTRLEEASSSARQATAPEVPAKRAAAEGPRWMAPERATTDGVIPGVPERAASVASAHEAGARARADASVPEPLERVAPARAPEPRSGPTSFLARSLPGRDSYLASSSQDGTGAGGAGPLSPRHAGAAGTDPRAPRAHAENPGAWREGAALGVNAPEGAVSPEREPMSRVSPSARSTAPALVVPPAAPAKASSGARKEAAPAAHPGAPSSLTPPEPARPPVLPPRREPAEPRVHIGEVHVIITAPVASPAPASSSALPGHGSDLLNRHYLRNA